MHLVSLLPAIVALCLTQSAVGLPHPQEQEQQKQQKQQSQRDISRDVGMFSLGAGLGAGVTAWGIQLGRETPQNRRGATQNQPSQGRVKRPPYDTGRIAKLLRKNHPLKLCIYANMFQRDMSSNDVSDEEQMSFVRPSLWNRAVDLCSFMAGWSPDLRVSLGEDEWVQLGDFAPDDDGPRETQQFSMNSIKQFLPHLAKTAVSYIGPSQEMKPYAGPSMGRPKVLFQGASLRPRSM